MQFILNPTDTDVFKTSPGRLQKVTTSYHQSRRHQDFWKKTSDLGRLEDVWFKTSWRHPIYDVLKTSDYDVLRASDLRRLEDISFTSSWVRPIYDIFKTSDFRHIGNVRLASFWKRRIYDVFKTSVKGRQCSNVAVTSVKRQKKWFFLISYCLKYSEKLKCFCLG